MSEGFTVECVTCGGKKYHTYDEAAADHDPDVLPTHRIKNIAVRAVTPPQSLNRAGFQTPQDAPSDGVPLMPPAPTGGFDVNALMKQFPYLFSPEARELTRAAKEVDSLTSRGRGVQRPQPIGEIPSFVDAQGKSDDELGVILPHASNCPSSRVKVTRGSTSITAECLTCKSKLVLTKR